MKEPGTYNDSKEYIIRFAKEVYQKAYPKEERRFVSYSCFYDWVMRELGDRPSPDWHLYLTDYPEQPACWVEVTDVAPIIPRHYG